MPEGDTLHRTAARLRPALAGQALTRFEAPRLLGDRPKAGVTITDVEAVGKHLLIHFADGLTLRTHLRMSGSWHLYRTGERWRKPRHLLRALVAVDGWEAVCFAAPVVQTYRPEHPGGALGTDLDPVGHLGPDLCRPDADLDECVRRMAELPEPEAEIATVLLDQRVAAGVGNVYKSEVLFACGVNPFTPVAAIDVDTRRRAHRDGGATAAGQPHDHPSHHGRRPTRIGRRLRPSPPALSPLRHARPCGAPGRAGKEHLLVSTLPAEAMTPSEGDLRSASGSSTAGSGGMASTPGRGRHRWASLLAVGGLALTPLLFGCSGPDTTTSVTLVAHCTLQPREAAAEDVGDATFAVSLTTPEWANGGSQVALQNPRMSGLDGYAGWVRMLIVARDGVATWAQPTSGLTDGFAGFFDPDDPSDLGPGATTTVTADPGAYATLRVMRLELLEPGVSDPHQADLVTCTPLAGQPTRLAAIEVR